MCLCSTTLFMPTCLPFISFFTVPLYIFQYLPFLSIKTISAQNFCSFQSQNKMLRAIILGAPASGKGTISSRIIKHFNLEHIASGDRLRLHIKNNTSLGVEAKKYINEGKLVPDELITKFILNEIKQCNSKSWLLDGFPRTLFQAQTLWKAQKIDVVLNLNVPFDVIIERVKGRLVHLPSGRTYNTGFNEPKIPGRDDITGEPLVQREDDKPEVVKKRLEQYELLTKPVIKFYEALGVLQTFTGKTSDEIWPNIKDYLSKKKLSKEQDALG
ncbi:GTP:AMP phosphotransferase AK3, mitochondrial [Agrilus planipennis]|uniref:GTP:AMP phosphotransferase, mitochondrial n=1 Tax=Agrilus planipennis TaxID=224129 RepID=A0A1W4WPZ8_AGRPL|nr:GTP:AMP phosphotransferase AK3, mitochondrial [Agrilus planipennis]